MSCQSAFYPALFCAQEGKWKKPGAAGLKVAVPDAERITSVAIRDFLADHEMKVYRIVPGKKREKS